MNIAEIRKEYQKTRLDEHDAPSNPINLFESWFQDVITAKAQEPNAMSLSTCGDGIHPTTRIVLLKGINKQGFEFYTNYHSEKGQALAANPHCCLNFFWPELERQVRINGEAVHLSPEESDAYFASRPRGSQIGAWVSKQSERIDDREQLDKQLLETETAFENKEVLRPPHWGGYLVIPHQMEFWQGRANRLHDRILYDKVGESAWKLERLSP